MSTIQEPFTYQGRLIFNGICRTAIRDDELDLDTITKRLPRFQEGSPENPGSGYEVSNVQNLSGDEEVIPPEFRQFGEDIIFIRYKYEDYETREALVDGELRSVAARTINEVDIYWIFPRYLLIRGSKTEAERARNDIGIALGGGVRINGIEFDFRFLLWLFYKHYRGQGVDSNVEIVRLTDAETRNKSGAPAEIQRFTDSKDVTRSASVLRDLLRILRGKVLTMIGGDFQLENYRFSANISTSGRIQLKSQYDIAEVNDLTRILLSILFVHRLTELYTEWEARPIEEKYPPEDFFDELAEDLSQRGVEVKFTLDETLIPYYKDEDLSEE